MHPYALTRKLTLLLPYSIIKHSPRFRPLKMWIHPFLFPLSPVQRTIHSLLDTGKAPNQSPPQQPEWSFKNISDPSIFLHKTHQWLLRALRGKTQARPSRSCITKPSLPQPSLTSHILSCCPSHLQLLLHSSASFLPSTFAHTVPSARNALRPLHPSELTFLTSHTVPALLYSHTALILHLSCVSHPRTLGHALIIWLIVLLIISHLGTMSAVFTALSRVPSTKWLAHGRHSMF